MKRRNSKLLCLSVVLVTILLLIGCGENPLNSPPELSREEGISVDEINWVTYKPEFEKQLKSLAKLGFTGKMVTSEAGGVVGGDNTFGNRVIIPPNAVDQNTYITVDVICIENGVQCGAGVEFLPNGQFNQEVTIEMSYAFLNITEDQLEEIQFYFNHDEDGRLWYPVDREITIDTEREVLSFKIDHFTRYGWGF